jgi:hypothetical protein
MFKHSVLVGRILLLGLLALLLPAPLQAAGPNLLANGSFEAGFVEAPGCGHVAVGWRCFTNRGAVTYGFYDDQWPPVVADGAHSQLIELNTYRYIVGADNDRYAGLAQTVQVTPGAQYRLTLSGMIRSTSLNSQDDPWRYRVQVGTLAGGDGDWRKVRNWSDVGWNDYYARTAPGAFSRSTTLFVPQTDTLTIFIRVWKKWGMPQEELNVNLDAISLTQVATSVAP